MSKPKIKPPRLTPPRLIRLHGKFEPDQDKRMDSKPLMDLWLEAQDPIARAKDRKLDREEKEWNELKEALDKLNPMVFEILRGDRASLEATEDASALVPDIEMRKKAFDWYSEILTRGPADIEREREELDAAIREQAMRKRHGRDQQTITNALVRLSDAVNAGEMGAAEALLQVAVFATQFLAIAARNHPDQIKVVAAKNGHWPVLASSEAGWEKDAVSRISELELGKDLARFKSRFRQMRGADVGLPARRWAKAAVRVIDDTRWRFPFFIHIVNELGGNDEWAEFAVTKGWDIERYPAWVTSAMKLEGFSIESFDAWKTVVREIIREQVPDFHLRHEWATQRATAEANGRNTPGEIQNAILDDIVSALKRLAPEASC